jgi:hypothetical protein
MRAAARATTGHAHTASLDVRRIGNSENPGTAGTALKAPTARPSSRASAHLLTVTLKCERSDPRRAAARAATGHARTASRGVRRTGNSENPRTADTVLKALVARPSSRESARLVPVTLRRPRSGLVSRLQPTGVSKSEPRASQISGRATAEAASLLTVTLRCERSEPRRATARAGPCILRGPLRGHLRMTENRLRLPRRCKPPPPCRTSPSHKTRTACASTVSSRHAFPA